MNLYLTHIFLLDYVDSQYTANWIATVQKRTRTGSSSTWNVNKHFVAAKSQHVQEPSFGKVTSASQRFIMRYLTMRHPERLYFNFTISQISAWVCTYVHLDPATMQRTHEYKTQPKTDNIQYFISFLLIFLLTKT